MAIRLTKIRRVGDRSPAKGRKERSIKIKSKNRSEAEKKNKEKRAMEGRIFSAGKDIF